MQHMIDETKSGEDEPPTRAEWLIDGMAAVQTVPPKKYLEGICRESASVLYTAFDLQPSKSSHNHGHLWRKENQKLEEKRSVRSPREKDLATKPGQSMPQGKDRSAFLISGENKIELIRFLIDYCKSQAVMCIFHQSCSYIPLCHIISPRLTKTPLIQCSTAPYNTIDTVE